MSKYCCECGYIGYCYGAPYDGGVSAPWCPECQRNNKLTPVKTKPLDCYGVKGDVGKTDA